MIKVIEASKTYSISQTPMATPRPRARIVKPHGKEPFVSIYNPSDYTTWKLETAIKISNLRIPAKDWNTINVTFFIPLSATDRKNGKKSQRMHCTLHEQKPDWDNFAKAFMDALHLKDENYTFFMPITDDSCVSSGVVRKVWINDPVGKIVFNLAKTEIDPLYAMNM